MVFIPASLRDQIQKRFPVPLRLVDDWNQAESSRADGISPYFWLRPTYFRQDLNRPTYKSYWKMKRRIVTPSSSARSVRRRRSYAGAVYRGRAYPIRYRRRYRSRRAWKLAARREIGNRVGVSNSKTVQTVNVNNELGVGTRKIEQVPLIKIARGTQINQRLRDLINLRGIKLEFSVINMKDIPLVVNWAIVHPKSSITATNNTTQEFATNEFFRGYGSTRTEQPNNSLSGLQWTNASINTDQFAVLKRGRILLNPGRLQPEQPADATLVYWPEKGSNYRFKKLYQKIGRQITFDPAISNDIPTEQVNFVYWIDNPFSTTGQLPVAGAVALECRAVCYFRETRN